MSDLIGRQAIALRLTAGSEEAGYLAQIFPLPQTPTVVIIKNGDLKEYITPGVSKEEFVRRIQNSFSAQPSQASHAPPAETASSTSPNQPPQQAPSAEVSQPAYQNETSDNVRRVLAERAARMQAQKEAAERKAKEEQAKAADKAKADAESGADTEGARAHKQAELVKKRKKQDDEERQRILKRIADDKAERKDRAAERERQRIDNQKIGDVAAALSHAPETKLPSTTKISSMTALQVRLFDGSTIRSRFKTATDLKEVRKWVDENGGGDNSPYTFKQVLTPLPNKNIDATEELKSLGDLGLAPSSTLVLIPVVRYSSAYDGQPPGGIFTRVLRLILGFLTWLLSLIGLGGAGPAPGQNAAASNTGSDSETSARAGSRVRGFQNPDDRRRDQQLYNGNSVRAPVLVYVPCANMLTFHS